MPAEDEPVVAALCYDEVAVAEDLAAWSSGELVYDGDGPPTIWVRTAKGPRPAGLGDWIVRRAEGDFYPCGPAEFAARHEPVDLSDDPLHSA